jgi:recombinational DNA repair ATPase RecF
VASGFGFNRARGEGERGRNKEEKTKTSFPLLHVQGKKKEKQCRLKTTIFVFPFFCGKCMKRRRFFQNAPFHLNGNWRQNVSDFKSVLQFA